MINDCKDKIYVAIASLGKVQGSDFVKPYVLACLLNACLLAADGLEHCVPKVANPYYKCAFRNCLHYIILTSGIIVLITEVLLH